MRYEIGQIVSGKEIGRNRTRKFIRHACEICGKERWEIWKVRQEKPERSICPRCARLGERNKRWIGGRTYDGKGYIRLHKSYIEPFFYPMVTMHRHILEHRYVMAKHLSRCLLDWEVVHHKNGIKDDNRIENLDLLPSRVKHMPSIRVLQVLRKQSKQIKNLEGRVTILEAENALLKKQLETECIYG